MMRLAEALERAGGTHTVEDVRAQLDRGEAQLWETEDATIVSEILRYPRVREVRLWLAAGELEAVLGLARAVVKWAKDEMGCERATVYGRKGWQKYAEREGWTPSMVLYSREI